MSDQENFGSVNYRAALAHARAISSQLRNDDPRFANVVLLIDEEGSVMFYRSAFMERLGTDWLLVFAEHHPAQVFCISDLRLYKQFRPGKTRKGDFDLRAAEAFFRGWLARLTQLPIGDAPPVVQPDNK